VVILSIAVPHSPGESDRFSVAEAVLEDVLLSKAANRERVVFSKD
jgi:hypothetical protein